MQLEESKIEPQSPIQAEEENLDQFIQKNVQKEKNFVIPEHHLQKVEEQVGRKKKLDYVRELLQKKYSGFELVATTGMVDGKQKKKYAISKKKWAVIISKMFFFLHLTLSVFLVLRLRPRPMKNENCFRQPGCNILRLLREQIVPNNR